MDGFSLNQFQGIHINDIPVVEDLLTLNLLFYDIDGNIIGKLTERSVQKNQKSLGLLRYNNFICHVSNIEAIFKSFRCPNCDTFFNRTSNLERHLTCNQRLKHVYPNNRYQTWETLFDTLLQY